MQLNLSLARVRSPNEGRRLLLPAQQQRRNQESGNPVTCAQTGKCVFLFSSCKVEMWLIMPPNAIVRHLELLGCFHVEASELMCARVHVAYICVLFLF